jgi:CheY-like chemotaxis protein
MTVHQTSSYESSLPDGLQVLVVEDNLGLRSAILKVLHQHGVQTITARSVQEGLAAFEQHHPHLLLSDILLPDGDGYTFIKTVRDRAREQGIQQVPAIAVTASVKDMDLSLAVSAGFQRYLCEPIETDRLMSIVSSLAQP